MIRIEDNISAYFDDDFINIIYRDLKMNKVENVDELLGNKEKLYDDEIHTFSLNLYQMGSIGKTSRELKREGVKFSEAKLLANDYNGPNPSYDIAFIKIIYSESDKVVLGFQIANKKDIKIRLEKMREAISNKLNLDDVSKIDIYGEGKDRLDIINIAAILTITNDENKFVKEVSANEIQSLYEKQSYFLDVREEDEYDDGHIKGAINIPLRSMINRLGEIPKDKEIYVYCRSAHRSLDAAIFLKNLGYKKVYNVKGGFIDLSFNEFFKDKGDLNKSILTNYNFD